MFCQDCGSKTSKTAKFCRICGNRLDDISSNASKAPIEPVDSIAFSSLTAMEATPKATSEIGEKIDANVKLNIGANVSSIKKNAGSDMAALPLIGATKSTNNGSVASTNSVKVNSHDVASPPAPQQSINLAATSLLITKQSPVVSHAPPPPPSKIITLKTPPNTDISAPASVAASFVIAKPAPSFSAIPVHAAPVNAAPSNVSDLPNAKSAASIASKSSMIPVPVTRPSALAPKSNNNNNNDNSEGPKTASAVEAEAAKIVNSIVAVPIGSKENLATQVVSAPEPLTIPVDSRKRYVYFKLIQCPDFWRVNISLTVPLLDRMHELGFIRESVAFPLNSTPSEINHIIRQCFKFKENSKIGVYAFNPLGVLQRYVEPAGGWRIEMLLSLKKFNPDQLFLFADEGASATAQANLLLHATQQLRLQQQHQYQQQVNLNQKQVEEVKQKKHIGQMIQKQLAEQMIQKQQKDHVKHMKHMKQMQQLEHLKQQMHQQSEKKKVNQEVSLSQAKPADSAPTVAPELPAASAMVPVPPRMIPKSVHSPAFFDASNIPHSSSTPAANASNISPKSQPSLLIPQNDIQQSGGPQSSTVQKAPEIEASRSMMEVDIPVASSSAISMDVPVAKTGNQIESIVEILSSAESGTDGSAVAVNGKRRKRSRPPQSEEAMNPSKSDDELPEIQFISSTNLVKKKKLDENEVSLIEDANSEDECGRLERKCEEEVKDCDVPPGTQFHIRIPPADNAAASAIPSTVLRSNEQVELGEMAMKKMKMEEEIPVIVVESRSKFQGARKPKPLVKPVKLTATGVIAENKGKENSSCPSNTLNLLINPSKASSNSAPSLTTSLQSSSPTVSVVYKEPVLDGFALIGSSPVKSDGGDVTTLLISADFSKTRHRTSNANVNNPDCEISQ